MVQLLNSLLYFYQKPEASNNEYLKEFKAHVESIDDLDACTLGKISFGEGKLNKTYNKTIDVATHDEIKKEVMSVLLLIGSNKLQYGDLKSMLAQHTSMGTNYYPCMVDETMNILNSYNKMAKVSQRFKSTKEQVIIRQR